MYTEALYKSYTVYIHVRIGTYKYVNLLLHIHTYIMSQSTIDDRYHYENHIYMHVF